MNKALLDTDTFSEILKARNAAVGRNAAAHRHAFPALTLSVVTVMEVVEGLHKVGREAEIRTFLATVAPEEVLTFDAPAAEQAGRIYADLERIGRRIGWADTVIAAIALRHGLELITGNTRHYGRIQALGYPLVLADWRA